MHKLIAIYKVPEDMDSFESYYNETHMPITRKIPNLKKVRVNKVFGTPMGKSDLHMIAELCFEDKATFKERTTCTFCRINSVNDQSIL